MAIFPLGGGNAALESVDIYHFFFHLGTGKTRFPLVLTGRITTGCSAQLQALSPIHLFAASASNVSKSSRRLRTEKGYLITQSFNR